jgi:hypothetical protein
MYCRTALEKDEGGRRKDKIHPSSVVLHPFDYSASQMSSKCMK